LQPPDYVLESAAILAEIASVYRPIRVRHSTTRRCMIEHLHYDYQFRSLFGGRILIFSNLMESREARECVNRMGDYIRKGFHFVFLSPTVLWARVRGKHYL
jgi:hypothetical protein